MLSIQRREYSKNDNITLCPSCIAERCNGEAWARELPLVPRKRSCTKHTERRPTVEPKPGKMARFLVQSQEDTLNPTWLSPDLPHEVAYIDMWNEDLSKRTDRHLVYYGFTRQLAMNIARATNELHHMFLTATEKVIGDDSLMAQLDIPNVFWPAIRRSWKLQRNDTLACRMDFAFDGKRLKLFEYNADSAAALMETGVVWRKWADAVGLGNRGLDAAFQLELIAKQAWQQLDLGTAVHVMIDDNLEEMYTAQYMQHIAKQADVHTILCVKLSDLKWQNGLIVDAKGRQLKTVWKLWSWNTVFDDYMAAQANRENIPENIWRADGTEPRLSDVLLHEHITVIEPLWKSVMNNKVTLAVLWELFPHHRNLLETSLQLTDNLHQSGHVIKPVSGRCGLNVTLVQPDGSVLADSHASKFSGVPSIYQELFRMPEYDGYFPVIGSWVIGGRFAGFCVREDQSRITGAESPCIACRILWNEDDIA